MTDTAQSNPTPVCRHSWLHVLRGCMAGLALLSACLPLQANAEDTIPKEYQVKAAFLYNFTKFIDWPAQRFTDKADPVVIGLLGTNPFGSELSKILAGRRQMVAISS